MLEHTLRLSDAIVRYKRMKDAIPNRKMVDHDTYIARSRACILCSTDWACPNCGCPWGIIVLNPKRECKKGHWEKVDG